MKKEEMKKTVSSSDNSFGVASVVLGICSIIFAHIFYGLVLGIISLVFANKQNKISANSWSRNGKILSIIGIILSIILSIVFIWQLRENPQLLSQIAGTNVNQ